MSTLGQGYGHGISVTVPASACAGGKNWGFAWRGVLGKAALEPTLQVRIFSMVPAT